MTKHSKTWVRTTVGIALVFACSIVPLARLSAQPLALVQDEPGGPAYLEGRALIQFKPNVADAALLDALTRGALTLIRQIQTDAMKASNHPGITEMGTRLPVRQLIQALRGHLAIEFVEPEWVYTHQDIPNDPLFLSGGLWGMYGDLL